MARKKTSSSNAPRPRRKKPQISDEELDKMNESAKKECKKNKANKYFVAGKRVKYTRKAHCRRRPGRSHAAVYRDFGPEAPLRYTTQAVERYASGQERAI